MVIRSLLRGWWVDLQWLDTRCCWWRSLMIRSSIFEVGTLRVWFAFAPLQALPPSLAVRCKSLNHHCSEAQALQQPCTPSVCRVRWSLNKSFRNSPRNGHRTSPYWTMKTWRSTTSMCCSSPRFFFSPNRLSCFSVCVCVCVFWWIVLVWFCFGEFLSFLNTR